MTITTKQRRKAILYNLSRDRSVKVTELSSNLRISEVSIRRDLQILEEQGLLKRVHGGAIALEFITPVSSLAKYNDLQRDKKERIGIAAAKLIHRSDSLIFDSGTTPLQVACSLESEILQSGNLTVITANLPIVRQLGHWPGVHLILLGGVYVPSHEAMVGPQTVDQLKGLHVDKMILGVDGITLSRGFTTSNVLEAEIDRAMVQAATEVIVVADSSKIGVIGLATIMPINGIHVLVTDKDAPPDFTNALKEMGIEVILV